MNAHDDDTENLEKRMAPKAPRDLADFHLRWPEFRPLAKKAASHNLISRQEREIILWLIDLADRIGERDIDI